MNQKIYIKQYTGNQFNAGPKAKRDVYEILDRNGFCSITYLPGFKSTNFFVFFCKTIIFLFAVLKCRQDIIIFENPIWYSKFLMIINKFLKIRKNKLILFIHDISSERSKDSSKKEEYQFLNSFHQIIAHNDSMKNFLNESLPKKNISSLGIFDYLIKTKTSNKMLNRPDLDEINWKIVFAGNLDVKKSPFIYQLSKKQLDWSLFLYGQGYENTLGQNNMTYKGSFEPDTPSIDNNSHFGLIWDGTSVDSCEGITGEYLKINNPHKLSMYMSLGLPVIVWKQSAVAKFILDNKIGFVVDSLLDISLKLKETKEKDYINYLKNVKTIEEKVNSGYYLSQIIKKL